MKRLIYHQSLSRHYTQCPYCKYENTDSEYMRDLSGLPYAKAPLDICPACGKQYDMECDVKKSKDVIECEALGLTGAVKKDEKGIWVKA